MTNDILLQVERLEKRYPLKSKRWHQPKAEQTVVQNVSFKLKQRSTLGIVGESGSGKTTLARCIMRLTEPTSGRIRFDVDGEKVSLTELSPRALRRIRPRLQMIFQDPHASLNPRLMIRDIIAEPLVINTAMSQRQQSDCVAQLLEAVGLAAADMARYPNAFSGGQRQRIGIARALALNPTLIVADEPVSALDVSVKAQVLNTLMDLRSQFGLSYLFISHDFAVIRAITDEVLILLHGQIMEMGNTASILRSPRHPYTQLLLSSVPLADPQAQRQRRLHLPPPTLGRSEPAPGQGCAFYTHCAYAEEICQNSVPALEVIQSSHSVACHRVSDIKLAGPTL